MTAAVNCPRLPPGVLSNAYAALHQVYAPTRRHREVGESLRRLVRSAGTASGHRGLAIIGPSGSGKTTAVEHAARWLRSELGLPAEGPSPLPLVLMTTRSTGKSLANNILQAAGDPLRINRSQNDAEMLIKASASSMPAIGFAVDEFHNAFVAKSEQQLQLTLLSMKTVVNSLAKPIVVMGIDSLEHFIDSDSELRQRFESKVYLTDPLVTSPSDIEDMRLVLKEMQAVAPCEADCRLDQPEMLMRLLVAAQCRFGSVINRVRKACELGADARQSAITLNNFVLAYRDAAPRNLRSDADNPFLMDIAAVKVRLKTMQAKN